MWIFLIYWTITQFNHLAGPIKCWVLSGPASNPSIVAINDANNPIETCRGACFQRLDLDSKYFKVYLTDSLVAIV